jgi:hypothetical protein
MRHVTGTPASARQVQPQGAGRQYPSPLRDWSSESGARALAQIVAERSAALGCPLQCVVLQVLASKTSKGCGRAVFGIRSRPIIPTNSILEKVGDSSMGP